MKEPRRHAEASGEDVKGQCIFCLEEKELSEEHIVPDSLGGDLIIDAVCTDCNSKLGSEIDGPFINSLPMSLARFAYGVLGKSGKTPNPFGGVGVGGDGLKVRLDNDLQPYVLPSVEQEILPDGRVIVRMVFDKADESQIRDEIAKKARRVIKARQPRISESDMQKRVNKVLHEAGQLANASSSNPTLQYAFNVDLTAMRLEYIKIAYETAFFLFGYEYVNESATAQKLRTAIVERQKRPLVHGQIPLSPDHLMVVLPERDRHFVMVLDGGVYVRLFTTPAMVQVEETEPRFMCGEDKAVVFAFDYAQRTHVREPLTDRLLRITQGRLG